MCATGPSSSSWPVLALRLSPPLPHPAAGSYCCPARPLSHPSMPLALLPRREPIPPAGTWLTALREVHCDQSGQSLLILIFQLNKDQSCLSCPLQHAGPMWHTRATLSTSLAHSLLLTTMQNRHCYLLCFIGEETEARRGKMTGPGHTPGTGQEPDGRPGSRARAPSVSSTSFLTFSTYLKSYCLSASARIHSPFLSLAPEKKIPRSATTPTRASCHLPGRISPGSWSRLPHELAGRAPALGDLGAPAPLGLV